MAQKSIRVINKTTQSSNSSSVKNLLDSNSTTTEETESKNKNNFLQILGKGLGNTVASIGSGVTKAIDSIADSPATMVSIAQQKKYENDDSSYAEMKKRQAQDLYTDVSTNHILGKGVENFENKVDETRASLTEDNPESTTAKVMSFTSGLGESVGRMLPTMAVSAISGGLGASSAAAQATGLAAMWTSVYDSTVDEKIAEGKDFDYANKTALVDASVEVATELMFGGIAGTSPDTGYIDAIKTSLSNGKAASELATKLGTSKAGVVLSSAIATAKKVGETTLGKGLFSSLTIGEMLEEGLEEMTSEVLDPILERVVTGDETIDDATLSQVIQAGLSGSLLSIAMAPIGSINNALTGVEAEASQQPTEATLAKTETSEADTPAITVTPDPVVAETATAVPLTAELSTSANGVNNSEETQSAETETTKTTKNETKEFTLSTLSPAQLDAIYGDGHLYRNGNLEKANMINQLMVEGLSGVLTEPAALFSFADWLSAEDIKFVTRLDPELIDYVGLVKIDNTTTEDYIVDKLNKYSKALKMQVKINVEKALSDDFSTQLRSSSYWDKVYNQPAVLEAQQTGDTASVKAALDQAKVDVINWFKSEYAKGTLSGNDLKQYEAYLNHTVMNTAYSANDLTRGYVYKEDAEGNLVRLNRDDLVREALSNPDATYADAVNNPDMAVGVQHAQDELNNKFDPKSKKQCAAIARQLTKGLRARGMTEVTVKVAPLSGVRENNTGYYDSRTKTFYLNSEKVQSKQTASFVLAHEVNHYIMRELKKVGKYESYVASIKNAMKVTGFNYVAWANSVGKKYYDSYNFNEYKNLSKRNLKEETKVDIADKNARATVYGGKYLYFDKSGKIHETTRNGIIEEEVCSKFIAYLFSTQNILDIVGNADTDFIGLISSSVNGSGLVTSGNALISKHVTEIINTINDLIKSKTDNTETLVGTKQEPNAQDVADEMIMADILLNYPPEVDSRYYPFDFKSLPEESKGWTTEEWGDYWEKTLPPVTQYAYKGMDMPVELGENLRKLASRVHPIFRDYKNRLKVLYHGTASDAYNKFRSFEEVSFDSSEYQGFSFDSSRYHGLFTTPSKAYAQQYAYRDSKIYKPSSSGLMEGQEGGVFEFFVYSSNPLIVDCRNNGYYNVPTSAILDELSNGIAKRPELEPKLKIQKFYELSEEERKTIYGLYLNQYSKLSIHSNYKKLIETIIDNEKTDIQDYLDYPEMNDFLRSQNLLTRQDLLYDFNIAKVIKLDDHYLGAYEQDIDLIYRHEKDIRPMQDRFGVQEEAIPAWNYIRRQVLLYDTKISPNAYLLLWGDTLNVEDFAGLYLSINGEDWSEFLSQRNVEKYIEPYDFGLRRSSRDPEMPEDLGYTVTDNIYNAAALAGKDGVVLLNIGGQEYVHDEFISGYENTKSIYNLAPNLDNNDMMFDLLIEDMEVNPEDVELFKQFREAQALYGTKAGSDIPDKITDGIKVSEFAVNTSGLELNRKLKTELMKDILNGDYGYTVMSDKDSEAFAQDWLSKYETADAEGNLGLDLSRAANNYIEFMADKTGFDKRDIAKGELLARAIQQDILNKGDTVTDDELNLWSKVNATLAIEATKSGQAVQAFSMLKKMTPSGRLYYLQQSLNAIRESLKATQKGIGSFVKKNAEVLDDIEKTPEYIALTKKLAAAQTVEELNAVEQEMVDLVASKIPATLTTRAVAWRYLAMLGNPRTHMRNVLSNAANYLAVGLTNRLSGTVQDVAKNVFNKNFEATATNKKVSAEVKEFVKNDWEIMKPVYEQGGRSLSFETKVEQARKSFGSNKVGKGIEAVNNANNFALNWEDTIFGQLSYKRAMENYITANNIDINIFKDEATRKTAKANDLLGKIRKYAMDQANKATYHESNLLATKLNELEKSSLLGELLVGGIAPFKKTPMNILKQGALYSGGGIIVGVKQLLTDVQSGKMSTGEAINNICMGMTGGMLIALGMFLKGAGVLKAGGSDDDREEYYDEMLGNQKYSITIGEKNYTIDWLTPISMPLFAGASVMEAMDGAEEDGEDISFSDLLGCLGTAFDPLTNLSLLSGVNDALSAYGDSNKIAQLGLSAAESYITQFIPTLSGQIARTVDSTRRTTYAPTDSDNILGSSGEKFLRRIIAKIPFLSQQDEAYINQWGEEEVREGNALVRALEQTVAPYYVAQKNSTEVDDKLSEIFAEAGTSSVLPSTPNAYFTIDGETYYLSAEDYTTVKKTVGQLSYKSVESILNSDLLSYLSTDEKADVISDAYSFARTYAKYEYATANEIAGYKADTSIEKINKALDAGISIGDYFICKQLIGSVTADKDSNGNTISGSKKKKQLQILAQCGLTESQMELFF